MRSPRLQELIDMAPAMPVQKLPASILQEGTREPRILVPSLQDFHLGQVWDGEDIGIILEWKGKKIPFYLDPKLSNDLQYGLVPEDDEYSPHFDSVDVLLVSSHRMYFALQDVLVSENGLISRETAIRENVFVRVKPLCQYSSVYISSAIQSGHDIQVQDNTGQIIELPQSLLRDDSVFLEATLSEFLKQFPPFED